VKLTTPSLEILFEIKEIWKCLLKDFTAISSLFYSFTVYRHLPPYPAFLNNACFMCSELISVLCSNSCYHHKKEYKLAILLNLKKEELTHIATNWICTSEQEACIVKSLKQLITHCWISRPNVSNVVTDDSSNPGFVAQQISILVSSFLLSTSNCKANIERNVCSAMLSLLLGVLYMD